MTITLKDVKKGITDKLVEIKTTETKIYDEQIPQGFTEPCFFIKIISANLNRQLGNRYKRRHLIDLHYFPSESNSMNEEMLNISEILYENLEEITVNGNLIRGINMRHEITDNVLHFFIEYSFYVIKSIQKEPSMENIYLKGGIKDV